LRHLLAHAVVFKMIAANPAMGIKGLKVAGNGFPQSQEDEVTRFEDRPMWTPRLQADVGRYGSIG
jgi:hypothetical protein